MTHGRSAYLHEGCRCDICRRANTDYQAAADRRRGERLRADPSLPVQHGTPGTYRNWMCRCEPCTTANTAVSGDNFYRAKRDEANNASPVVPAQRARDAATPITGRPRQT